jgi:hypothetical protein
MEVTGSSEPLENFYRTKEQHIAEQNVLHTSVIFNLQSLLRDKGDYLRWDYKFSKSLQTIA